MTYPEVFFDRRVDDGLLAALDSGGPLHGLIERRNRAPGSYDVQLRREHKGTRCWASFYVGLTTVLDVDCRPTRQLFRLRAASSHRKKGGFDEAWREWQSLEGLTSRWAEVDGYLDRITTPGVVDERWTAVEGAVHGAIACGGASTYRVVNREASPAFRDRETKRRVLSEVRGPILHGVGQHAESWWPKLVNNKGVPNLGTSCDFLAIDEGGRVIALEAKPATALAGIVRGSIQVRVYAELLARWLLQVRDAHEHLDTMMGQRVQLGLSAAGSVSGIPTTVVPVLAVGAGSVSAQARPRLKQVADALAEVPPSHGVGRPEVWILDERGELVERW